MMRLGFTCLFFASLTFAQSNLAPRREAFLSGALVEPKNVQKSPEKVVADFFTGIGSSIVETGARLAGFSTQILSANFIGAIDNLAGLIDRKSFDSTLIQLMAKLPTILENNLMDKVSDPNAYAIKQYVQDNNLSDKEAAAILKVILNQSKDSPTEKKKTIVELKETLAIIKRGGGLTSAQIGSKLAESMKVATEKAPMGGFLFFGSPLNPQRRLAITKVFTHSTLQKFAVPYAKGVINPVLASASQAGLKITGINDSFLTKNLENVFAKFKLRECISGAKDEKGVTDCVSQFGKKETQIVGITLDSLRAPLKNGAVQITLHNPNLKKPLEMGPSLSQHLEANVSELQKIEKFGDPAVLNRLSDSYLVETTKTVINESAKNFFQEKYANDPARAKYWETHTEQLVDNFKDHLSLIDHDKTDLSNQLKTLFSSKGEIAENAKLDKKIRGPFELALKSQTAKKAIFALALDLLPISKALRDEIAKTPREKLPPGLKIFMSDLEEKIDRFSNVPKGQMTISYLKQWGDPESLLINKALGSLDKGALGFINHFSTCDKNNSLCKGLEAPLSDLVTAYRISKNFKSQDPRAEQCVTHVPAAIQEAFQFISESKISVRQDIYQVLKSTKNPSSQKGIHCLLSGLAEEKGLPPKEAGRLFQSLNAQYESSPQKRDQLVDQIYTFLTTDPAQRPKAQAALLKISEANANEVFSHFAEKSIDQFVDAPSNQKKFETWKQSERNQFKGLAKKFLDNVDLVDENSSESMEVLSKKLLESPMKTNSHWDQVIKNGIQKTLQDPAVHDNILETALSAEATLTKKSFIGEGLRQRILNKDPETFGFHDSFGKGISELSQDLPSDESTLSYLQSLSDPKSRRVDAIVAKQKTPIKKLFMSLVKCDNPRSELCRGCLGEYGNWILPNQKSGNPEVLFQAPAGSVIDLLRSGYRRGSSGKMQEKCKKAIPDLVESVVEQAADPTNPVSVIEDPTVFLNALSKVKNQTALNCVLSTFVEERVFQKQRDKFLMPEAYLRGFFSLFGGSDNVGLLNLTGDQLFETLETMNSNSVLLDQKKHMISMMQNQIKVDSTKNRHELNIASKDLIRSIIGNTISEPDMATKLFRGTEIPETLLKASLTDPLALDAIACVQETYSRASLPLSLYIAEDISVGIASRMRPWVESAPDYKILRPNSLPRAENNVLPFIPIEASQNNHSAERCVKDLPPVPTSPPSSTSPPGSYRSSVWVGGYEHTLKNYENINRAQGGLLLTSGESQKVLSETNALQKTMNDLLYRNRSNLTDEAFNEAIKAKESFKTLTQMKKLAFFPSNKILSLVEEHLSNPRDFGKTKELRNLLLKECAPTSTYWSSGHLVPKYKSLIEQQSDSSSSSQSPNHKPEF